MCDLCVVPCVADYVKNTNALSFLPKEKAWAIILAEDEQLMQCILTDIPQWADAVKRKTEKEQQGKLRHSPRVGLLRPHLTITNS